MVCTTVRYEKCALNINSLQKKKLWISTKKNEIKIQYPKITNNWREKRLEFLLSSQVEVLCQKIILSLTYHCEFNVPEHSVLVLISL